MLFRLFPLCALALLGLSAPVPDCSAQDKKPRPVRQSRLSYAPGPDGRERATLGGKNFSGVAFVEESWGRAEMTYQDGILNGPVTVIVRNKVFSQFEYQDGKKILKE